MHYNIWRIIFEMKYIILSYVTIILFTIIFSINVLKKLYIKKTILTNIQNAVLIFNKTGKIKYLNKYFLNLLKIKHNNFKFLKINDIFKDEDLTEIYYDNNFEIKVNKIFKWTVIINNNEEIPVNVKLKYINNNKYILAEIFNVNEEKIVEKELRESQRLLSTLISNLPGIVYLADNDKTRTMKFISEGCYELTGYNPSDFIDNKKLSYLDIIHPEDKSVFKNEIDKVIKGKTSFHITYRIKTINNLEKWIWERGKPIFTTQKKLLAIGGFISDITEFKRMEQNLAEEKERLAVTLKSIGDGVITTDINGNVILLNYIAEKLTGWIHEEAFGKPLKEVFNIINEKTRKPCKNPIEKVLEKGKVVGLANHTVLISKDGTERMIADSGAPIKDKDSKIIGVVLVFRDVTEKNKIEEEMNKILKLESLGILAGGIAHDFNNILTAILGNINLAKLYSQKDPNLYELLLDAEKATYNSKNLTDQLLTFAKGGSPIKKTGMINKILEESLLFSLRGSNMKYEINIDNDLAIIDFDEGQMNQVFNNLTINSRQAMPNGGKLKVTAKNYFVNKDNIPLLNNGKYIKITFEDEGPGIPKENISKIFDPFFTTKKNGKGLGLASVFSIIKKHDGFINVENKTKKGVKFNIYLPLSSNTQYFDLINEEFNDVIKGKGKILYMDDEYEIRNIARKALKFLGYDVEFANDGLEAIEKYNNALKKKSCFDCVILDLTIPGGMGGIETIKQLIEINTNVKCIVTSGYSNDPVMANYKKFGFKYAVIKPFKIEELSKAIDITLKS